MSAIEIKIWSDASFDEQTRAGGWGGYAICDRGVIEDSGQLTSINSVEAELQAALAAIYMVVSSDLFKVGDLLILWVDCDVIPRVAHGGGRSEWMKVGNQKFIKLRAEYDLNLAVRKTRRKNLSRVNALARIEMKKARCGLARNTTRSSTALKIRVKSR